tara:strand:- start:716 stop:1789 length:1074 start_codon:yes stop_codon:yes gene_type:complete
MPTEMISLHFLSVFSLISFFIALLIHKISHKLFKGLLLDEDFNKPQAFHNLSVPRAGGLFSIISLSFFFILNYFLFDSLFYEYLIITFSLFLLGFLDDIKFNISPKTRLILMIAILIISILFFSIEIERIDFWFISYILQFKVLNIIFVLLCFLFIINGANLIDGFNGLLAIHLIIINLILLSINLNKNIEQDFTIFITAQIIVLLIFLLFNFPRAKIFLGDSGAYLFGSLTVLNVIKTNNLNPEITSFFFCIILFYLFFEVFFSFFRKILNKKSPLKPDDKHFHMLLFKSLKSKGIFTENNYMTSIIINIIFIILISPALFLKSSSFHLAWFFTLLLIYLIGYFFILKNKSTQNFD